MSRHRPTESGVMLIEVVLAIGLLGTVMVASLSWMKSATRRVAAVAEPLRWATAAEHLLQLIADDLNSGDTDVGTVQAKRWLVPEESLLQIRTRGRAGLRGPVRRLYSYRPMTRSVWVDEQPQPGALLELNGGERRRLLLEEVDRFQCEVDEDDERLSVKLVSKEHGERRRVYDVAE